MNSRISILVILLTFLFCSEKLVNAEYIDPSKLLEKISPPQVLYPPVIPGLASEPKLIQHVSSEPSQLAASSTSMQALASSTANSSTASKSTSTETEISPFIALASIVSSLPTFEEIASFPALPIIPPKPSKVPDKKPPASFSASVIIPKPADKIASGSNATASNSEKIQVKEIIPVNKKEPRQNIATAAVPAVNISPANIIPAKVPPANVPPANGAPAKIPATNVTVASIPAVNIPAVNASETADKVAVEKQTDSSEKNTTATKQSENTEKSESTKKDKHADEIEKIEELAKNEKWVELKKMIPELKKFSQSARAYELKILIELAEEKPNPGTLYTHGNTLLQMPDQAKNPFGLCAMAYHYCYSKKPKLDKAYESISTAISGKVIPKGAKKLYWIIFLKMYWLWLIIGIALPIAALDGFRQKMIAKRKEAELFKTVDSKGNPSAEKRENKKEIGKLNNLLEKLKPITEKIFSLINKLKNKKPGS
ncbi:MAG: hypothetical protein HQM10_01350 [Candidatus Riflebacteria bacterium]|nr:hypothetical protein [Candidatus Riflebacteria bacterium]